jgi:hypothetical protein
VNNRIQKISIKYKAGEQLIINGMSDNKFPEIIIPMIEIFETTNISFDFFSNRLISSLFVSPILFGETKPQIISNGFRYDGLSFL